MVSGYMLYALWLVLAAIGLDVLLGVYRAFQSNSFDVKTFLNFLRSGILQSVLPLLIIAYMMPLDPTGWILTIAYYVSAAAVFVKYLLDLAAKLKN